MFSSTWKLTLKYIPLRCIPFCSCLFTALTCTRANVAGSLDKLQGRWLQWPALKINEGKWFTTPSQRSLSGLSGGKGKYPCSATKTAEPQGCQSLRLLPEQESSTLGSGGMEIHVRIKLPAGLLIVFKKKPTSRHGIRSTKYYPSWKVGLMILCLAGVVWDPMRAYASAEGKKKKKIKKERATFYLDQLLHGSYPGSVAVGTVRQQTCSVSTEPLEVNALKLKAFWHVSSFGFVQLIPYK